MVPCLLEAEDESVDAAAAAAVKDTARCWMEVDLEEEEEEEEESTGDDCLDWDA